MFTDILKDDDYDDSEIPEHETEMELEARLALGEVAKVKSIQMWNKLIPKRGYVRTGDYCAVRLLPTNKKLKKYLNAQKKKSNASSKKKSQMVIPFVRPGAVLGSLCINQYPLRTVKEFSATIILYNLPCGNAETSLGVRVGYAPIVDVHTAHVQCRIIDIVKKRARGKDDRVPPKESFLVASNRNNDSRASRKRSRRGRRAAESRESRESKESRESRLRKLKEKEDMEKKKITMKTGDCCDVRMVPFRPLAVEPFNVCPALSRFVLRDTGRVVGCGIVKSVKFGMHHGSHEVEESDSSSDDEEDFDDDNDVIIEEKNGEEEDDDELDRV